MIAVATVDLVRTPVNGSVWHLVAIPQQDVTVCQLEIPAGVVREDAVDAHVVSHRGRRVCSHCRRQLR